MMFTMPVYDMMLLPGVTFYFKKDIFQQLGNQDAKAGDDVLFLMQRTDKDRKDLTPEDFYPVGVSGKLDSVDNEGNIRIRTVARVDLSDLEMAEDGILANASIRPDTEDITPEEEKAIFDRVKNVLLNYISQFQWGVLARNYVLHWKNLEETLCAVSGYIHIPWEDKYRIIETDSRKERCELIEKAIREAIEVNRVGVEAENAQKENNERLYREAALKKQIELLQQELDDMHPENVSDVRRFEQKIEASGMGEEARKEADKVLNRMKQEGQDGHEYGMLYDYLEFVTSLSWKPEPAAAIDLKEAEKILDEDHYGLSKVKERIIQQLAVMALNKKQSGSVLLFVGAPGTGKTSIGQSIARALGRKYVRISLGGVRDEAEIRGHRRTYIGAMPGRIANGMKQAGVKNPLMLLDEIDKVSSDYKGDTSSALLEVLDSEQNNKFRDHYVELPLDLSEVLFIATANDVQTIPRPLLDRMELIEVSSYTENEKLHIAKEHLLEKQIEKNGLSGYDFSITDKAMKKLISSYTREAGVRSLERKIGEICRKAAREFLEEGKGSIKVTETSLKNYLGKERYTVNRLNDADDIGIVRGLAWTSVGGDTLEIEVNVMPGKGELLLTGQLGDVMKESAMAGISYIRSVSREYGIDDKFFKENDIHIHIPEGAVPKDGPSAGITMATAMTSAITKLPVRADIAMTGEITLRGRVLPIGGLKEKLLAAKNAGIRLVLVPEKNRPDVAEISSEIKKGLEIRFVSHMDEVLKAALVKNSEN